MNYSAFSSFFSSAGWEEPSVDDQCMAAAGKWPSRGNICCIYSKFWVANVSLLLDSVRSRKSLCYVLGLTDLCICLCQYWTDIYLTWNPDIYPGVQNLRFPSDQVWTPDILLYNRSELLPRSCSVWLTLAHQLVCFGEGLESVWTSATFLQNDLLSWDLLEAVQSYRR